MIERPRSLGMYAEGRALRPESGPVEPNANDPATHPPATVGPPSAVPGDPNGVEVIIEGQGSPWPRSILRPSPWSGYPDEWETPNWGTAWGQLETLVDIAWTCFDLNSSVLATMPPYLVNPDPRDDTSWIENPDPDKYTSWEEFAKQLFWDFQAGEVFVLCTARYDATGLPARFHVVNPVMVNAEIVDGRRSYSIGGLDVTDDLLHIRYVSRTDDAHGHGPMEFSRARLVSARMLTRYATGVAASGIPNSILTHPDNLTAKQADDLHTQWLIARTSSMGLPAVLSGGVTFQTVQLSPEEMALVDLAKFTEGRIAVMCGVPPSLVGLPSGGDPMTYKNQEGIYEFHWRAYLRPRAQIVMPALSGWLLPPGTRVELNRDAYVEPGPLERAQRDQILHGIVEVDAETGETRYAKTVGEVRLNERFDTPATAARTGVLT